jgi:hypothetical protein
VNKDICWGLFSGGLKAKKNIMGLLEETHPLIPLEWIGKKSIPQPSSIGVV